MAKFDNCISNKAITNIFKVKEGLVYKNSLIILLKNSFNHILIVLQSIILITHCSSFFIVKHFDSYHPQLILSSNFGLKI
jgi:hypothetical protein